MCYTLHKLIHPKTTDVLHTTDVSHTSKLIHPKTTDVLHTS